MSFNSVRAVSVVLATLVFALIPLHAQASHCSAGAIAGTWAYSYTGSIVTPNGFVPAASVGRYSQDAAGNISGTQTRSVAGTAGVEEISGTVSVNADCTGKGTINVIVNGELQRTAVLALVYDSNTNHARMIFESLTLPDGTNVPVVLTIDANRLLPKD